MSLMEIFQWLYDTPVGETIRDSTWLFPVIEAFHLLGLGLTIGAVLLVQFRLLGVGLNGQPVAQLAQSAEPLLIFGIAIMFVTGIPLFMSESIKALYSFAFWIKMTCLFLVLIFTFTIHRRLTRTDVTTERPVLARAIAIISLVLWFGVAWGGRWIGFS